MNSGVQADDARALRIFAASAAPDADRTLLVRAEQVRASYRTLPESCVGAALAGVIVAVSMSAQNKRSMPRSISLQQKASRSYWFRRSCRKCSAFRIACLYFIAGGSPPNSRAKTRQPKR